MIKRTLFLAVAIVVLCASTAADEGMWLLDAMSRLPLPEMKKRGLELSPEQIFSHTNPSLKDAIVLLGGGTGGFISAEGLIVTNHHVAYGGIRALSSVHDDYLKNGFLASTRDRELSTSYNAEIVQSMTDVTAQVFSAVNDTMKEEERDRAIRSKRKEIEDKWQDSTTLACRIVDMYGGAKYCLFVSLRLEDVRLVYAPPQAIGNFGGETDNWMWPRHTGDFSLVRAYVGPDGKPAKYAKENVPYKPRMFMPVSTQGAPDGSFAMIMGFPGRTFRYREAAAVQLAQEETLPWTEELYDTRIKVIERWSDKDRAIALKYASKLRGIANTKKNYAGTLAGLRRTNLVVTKKLEDEKLEAFIASKPDLARRSGTTLADLTAATDELRMINRKNVYMNSVNTGMELFQIAAKFGSYVNSLKKDDKGDLRDPEEKDRQPMRQWIGNFFKDYEANLDRDMVTALILKNAELPPDQQLKTFAAIYGNRTGNERERRVREFVDELFEDTRLVTKDGCEKLLMRNVDDILDDEAVKFHKQYTAETSPVSAKFQSVLGKFTRLRAKYVAAVLQLKNSSLSYPDANRTLRLTYGKVVDLRPRDAVAYSASTTLTGVMEKESDADEFLVPSKLKELWQKKDFGRYADQKLKDVPVAFISDLDITGGNSGSPVINGKGELIGCAFDGNWEGVVGDYVFEERMNRTISVDARYILFVLDKFSGAEHIMKELVIH